MSSRARQTCFALTSAVIVSSSACDASKPPDAVAPPPSNDPADAGAGPSLDGAPDASLSVQAPFFMYYENVYVRVTLGGVSALLLYDTGSPEIYLDKAAAAKLGLAAGKFDVAIAGVSLGEREVALVDTVFGAEPLPGLPERVVGYAGNALFAGFAVGLNFRDQKILVSRDAPVIPAGVEVQATEVPFQLVKGYLSIPCGFVKGSASGVCLFDTGAMTTLSFEAYWSTLPHPTTRVFPEESIDSQGATLHSYFQRDQATMIGALEVPGDAVDVAVDFNLLASLATELHLDLVGLVGVLSFKSFYTTIDYANHKLLFRRFSDASKTFPSPFVGYGFSLDAGSSRVAFVAPGSSAEMAGVAAGDVLTQVDGASVASSPPRRTLAQVIPSASGASASFTFTRGPDTRTVTITGGDALPPP